MRQHFQFLLFKYLLMVAHSFVMPYGNVLFSNTDCQPNTLHTTHIVASRHSSHHSSSLLHIHTLQLECQPKIIYEIRRKNVRNVWWKKYTKPNRRKKKTFWYENFCYSFTFSYVYILVFASFYRLPTIFFLLLHISGSVAKQCLSVYGLNRHFILFCS